MPGPAGASEQAHPQVVVVGDVIDDVVVQPHGPIAHDTDTPATITPTAGGSGANAAVWLAHAGARVRFLGRVGAEDRQRHAGLLRAAGVDPVLVADPVHPTGRIVILATSDGARTMLTDRGANVWLVPDELPDDLLDGAAGLHISGYSLLTDPVRMTVLAMIADANRRGVRVSVDPGSVGFLAAFGAARFLALLDGCALLLPNADEARLLASAAGASIAAPTGVAVGPDVRSPASSDAPGDAKSNAPGDAAGDLDRIVTALLDVVPAVAVTRGRLGVRVGWRGTDPASTRHHLDVAAHSTKVVDTTGAGDAFTGGFVAAWLRGADWREAAERGVALATWAVTLTGGRPTAGTGDGPNSLRS